MLLRCLLRLQVALLGFVSCVVFVHPLATRSALRCVLCVQVALLGFVSFVVFFLPRKDLSSRLGVIVTLYLALAAVQVQCSGWRAIPCGVGSLRGALLVLSGQLGRFAAAAALTNAYAHARYFSPRPRSL